MVLENSLSNSFKLLVNSILAFSYSEEKSNGNFLSEITYLLIIYSKNSFLLFLVSIYFNILFISSCVF